MRHVALTRNRPIPFVAITTSILAIAMLVHAQRVEAQGATRVETVTETSTNAIAVQLNSSGNPVILFDGMKASCTDPNCSFPVIDSFFDDFSDRQNATRSIGFDAQGFPYLWFGSRFAANRFPDTLVRCLDSDCRSQILHQDVQAGTVLRNDGLAMTSFQNQGTGRLRLAHCVDLACSSRNMFTTIAEEGQLAALDVDNDGNPIMVFSVDGRNGWSIVRCSDLGCSSPVVTQLDIAGVITQVSIAVNRVDEPVLSIVNGLSRSPRDLSLQLLQCDDPNCASFSKRTIDNANVNAVMELDANDFAVLAFRKSGTVRLARCQDEACENLSMEVVDEATGGIPALTLDELGHPVLAYRDSRVDTLKLARCGNPNCLAFSGNLPGAGSYNLRSVASGRYLDADRNGAVGTSRVPRADDVWDLDLVIPNASLPYSLENQQFETPIERNDWVTEDAGDGTFFLRRVSDSTENYLSTSGNGVLLTTRDQSDRWEFIPVN